MSSVPGPHSRPSLSLQGMAFSVPSGQTVSRWPSSSTRPVAPALDFAPKRASSRSPKPFCRWSFTRPPRPRAWAAASATQSSTAALSSEGDSARTSCSIRSSRAGSLRRAPASSARIGTGESVVGGISKPFKLIPVFQNLRFPDSTTVNQGPTAGFLPIKWSIRRKVWQKCHRTEIAFCTYSCDYARFFTTEEEISGQSRPPGTDDHRTTRVRRGGAALRRTRYDALAPGSCRLGHRLPPHRS